MKNAVRNTSIAGSILAAILSSVCCIGPIVFALLGIGGAGFVLKFERFRPLFITLALAFLMAAGYFTFRKKPAEQCDPGSYCANPRSGRVNLLILGSAVIIVVGAIFIPGILSWFF